jgi:hypothetical protein
MTFIRAVAGHKMADHKRNEVIREEVWVTNVDTAIKYYGV